MEDNKIDPNCIVKGFQNHTITLLKDENKYLFKASDVAKALEITNIRTSIQNYTEKERVVRRVDTPGGGQDTIFLTSHGVYRILYNSKKKIAEKFREWVGDILDDIIFNNSIELQKELEENKKQFTLENTEMQKTNEKEKKMIKEHTYITSYHKRAVVYLVTIDKTLINKITKKYN
jgi:prophage antirepressor-like protein